jgi:cation transport protein ChaC
MAADSADLWIFGYGSLMWRPGFEYLERKPVRLHGVHRSLCVFSYVHRGTPEKPGLVLGLDRGGSCRGIAFRISGSNAEKTMVYLREREQATNVYVEAKRRIVFIDEQKKEAQAVCYLVDRMHEQYAGVLSRERQLELVQQGEGRSGVNRDYVLATVKELEALGIRDATLEWLAARL